MARLRLVAASLVAAIFTVSGSALAAPPKPVFPVTVEAANGAVTLGKRPQRIVSLSPTATETLYAIGAGRQVVAVDALSNYPKQAPRTNMSGYRPNAEAIAGYRPDLVLVRSDGGIIPELERLGIAVMLDPEAASLADAYAQIRELGRATGHPARALAVVATMQKQINAAIKSAHLRGRGFSIYHELTTDYYSATSKTFIGQIYRLFGLRNIADAAGSPVVVYPRLSAEYILTANPDLIFLADANCCGQSFDSVASRAGWGTIAAVKTRQVIALDDDVVSRWGPRVVLFVKRVAAAVRRAKH